MKYVLAVTVAALLTVFSVHSASAQVSTLTNADVVRFVTTMHMSDEVVIALISEASAGRATRFDLSPAAVVDLETHGVSPAVIAAMRQPAPAPPPAAVIDVPRLPSTPPVVPLSKQQSTPASIDLPKGFSPNSVPRSYAGMDCVKIVAALKPLPLTKSQFETSTAYEQRIATIVRSGSLYESIKMNDTLAFKFNGEVEPIYDADKGILSIHFHFGGVRGSFQAAYWAGEPILQMLYEPLVVTQSPTSTYVGTTGFGVKANVRKITERVCGLLRTGGEWVATDSSKPGGGPGVIAFPMSVVEAQSFVRRPGVLLIGKLESPFVLVGGRDFQEPTRDKPVDRQTTVDGIVLRLAEVWYYDVNTGRVYYRQHVRK